MSERGSVTAEQRVSRSSPALPLSFLKIRPGPREVFLEGSDKPEAMSLTMKFVLVNHRTPLDSSTCAECAGSLASGYLKAVSTQRQYCDYDCYVRHEARRALTSWLTAPYQAPLEMMTSFAAASCCSSMVIARVALRIGELMTVEISRRDRQS